MMKFTHDHEWLEIEGDVATVGITEHAQETLGDVVFIELPEVGKHFTQKDVAGVIESVKAAADIYMPLSGEILEANQALQDDPSLVNSDPLGAGWCFKIKLFNPSETDELLDAAAYQKRID